MLDEDRLDARDVQRRRHLVVGEVRVQHAALAIDDLLGERLAQPLRHAALDLPLDVRRVHGEADVLGHDVRVDADLARLLVDGEIDGVGVKARRVKGRVDVALDALGVVGGRRRDEGAVGDEPAPGRLRGARELGERTRGPPSATHDGALAAARARSPPRRAVAPPGAQICVFRSATAARHALPTANAVRLPCAPKSNGVERVSAETTLMSASSTPSSSASTWAAPVSAAGADLGRARVERDRAVGVDLDVDARRSARRRPPAAGDALAAPGRRAGDPPSRWRRRRLRRHSSRPTAVEHLARSAPRRPRGRCCGGGSSSGSMPSASAMMSICDSTAKLACGPDGARNEPKLVLLV